MGISQTHAAVLLMIVVVGAVGVSSFTDPGSGGEAMTVEGTEDRQSVAAGGSEERRSVTAEGTTGGRSSASNVAFEVRTTLNNSDAAGATRSIELVVEDEDGFSFTVDERTVSLSAGETREVTLSAPADAMTAGRYDYALGDEAGTLATGTVTLEGPAFDTSKVRAEPVVRGAIGTVSVTVRNRGDFRGMRTLDLHLDRNRDGTYDASEIVATRAPLLRAGEDASATLSVRTDGLEPGTYAYRVEVGESVEEGTLTVLRPATFRLAGSTMTTDAVRGERFNGSVTLVNAGDVRGNATVHLDGPTEAFDWNRTTTLDGNASTTLEFAAGTGNLTRGNYSIALSTANDSATGTLRVRESHLAVDDLDGPRSADVDDDIRFAARVWNTGDAAANRTVEHRIDLDGDDDPETVVENRSVDLAPGERTTVEFTLAEDDRDRFDDRDLLGTHVYGVYSGDANATDVVVVRHYSSGSSSSTSSAANDEPEPVNDEPEIVSRDVITQEKYGLDYDEVSNETRSQIDEIHERQPFSDGLVVTEVLTREEIARQEFGLDVGRNDAFEFTSIEVETQQEIEAAFDAQFESDDGDRIESWDELATERYESDYAGLDADQRETVRSLYRGQFER
ncbi:hypothetical protein [Halorubrum cibi]|uniref:CARDB protein n=1 Tax=Halorubrum cibi TaxID=413815 RepID=A0A521C3E4_9EURY|nr:hypothetical protein [Halorubrum cibi]SMO53919.1 hypothetical protein SAMN06264867_103279 [Halorubrum cibi]